MVGQLHLAPAFWGPVPVGSALIAHSLSLPTGTTTFVSADVDTSASRWEAGSDEVAEAMKDVDAVFSAQSAVTVVSGRWDREKRARSWPPLPGRRRRSPVPWTSSASASQQNDLLADRLAHRRGTGAR
jgi:hypothetical protein